MFHKFFKPLLSSLRNNQETIKNIGPWFILMAVHAYYYPGVCRKLMEHEMLLFHDQLYNQLTEKEKLAIKQDPKKEQAFREECVSSFKFLNGPPV